MRVTNLFNLLMAALFGLLMIGCAAPQKYDYTAFKASRPRSILVLPPVNNSPEVRATDSVLAQVTRPLAESGYYVMPVTLVAEAFKENGISSPADMHATSPEKLRQIFGADAVLYINVSNYGTVYSVFNSASIVTAQAKLVDLKTGQQLWDGKASASSAEGENNQGGLAALLLTAIVKQVVGTITDESHRIAGVTTARLLSAGSPSGILYGPRSPNYGKD